MYTLERPAPADKDAFMDWTERWGDEPIIPASARLAGRSYAGWLADTLRGETQPPKGLVAASTYLFRRAGGPKVLGVFNLRHALNAQLLALHGHIGYGLCPDERGKGLAPDMLRLGLEKARGQGMERVLVCCHTTNPASRQTILRCGGVLENEVLDEALGRRVQRYWIPL